MLVDTAIERWINSKLRADNTSVVTVMLDPPGPPRAEVLKNRQRELAELNSGRDVAGPSGINAGDRGSMALLTNTTAASVPSAAPPPSSVPGPSRGAPLPSTSPVPGPSCSSAPAVVPDEAAVAASDDASSSSTDSASHSVPGPSSSEPQKHCKIISRYLDF